jgi:sugar lactone lactonase YvrE
MYRPDAFLRMILLAAVLLWATSSIASGAALKPGNVLVADQGGFVYHYAADGTDLGVFASGIGVPSWITVDSSGNVYVSGYTGQRVDKFSATGQHLLTIPTAFAAGGVAVGQDGTIFVADYFGADVYRYTASGASLGLFVSLPLGRADFIALDSTGHLYVTDFTTGTVRRVSPAGGDLGTFVALGGAEGLAFDGEGNLYVSSFTTGVIQKYSPSGTELGVFAPAGSGYYGLAFDSEGNLYSSASISGTIKKFSPGGGEVQSFGTGGRDLVIVPQGGPTDKDECKNGGWRGFQLPRSFKSQGDCIQFVNTGR